MRRYSKNSNRDRKKSGARLIDRALNKISRKPHRAESRARGDTKGRARSDRSAWPEPSRANQYHKTEQKNGARNSSADSQVRAPRERKGSSSRGFRRDLILNPELKTLLRSHHLVIGKRAVGEILQFAPERVALVLMTVRQDLGGICPVQIVEGDFLSNLLQTDAHQGVTALVKPLPKQDLKSWLYNKRAQERCLILALDSIQDPHNVGALLRAAECFGVDAVLWSYNRVPAHTPVLSKASAGASELVPQIQVSNLAQALRDLKEAGFWVVLADADKDAESLVKFEYPKRTILVLGSEGDGAKELTRKLADFKVFIPMFGQISSLNVSQAGAVMLSKWVNERSSA